MSAASIEGDAFILQELFERWSYDIDYYQREFAWSADDVRTLVDDLVTQFRMAKRDPRTRQGMRLFADPYFLGPFVYHDERPGVRFLVDGQQRFTVLHLVFIHLYRQAQALGRRDTEDKLNRVIRFAVPGAVGTSGSISASAARHCSPGTKDTNTSPTSARPHRQ